MSARALVKIAFLLAACSDGGDGGSGSAGTGRNGGTSGAAGSGAGADNPADYLDRPLREQVTALEQGAITSAGLTQAY